MKKIICFIIIVIALLGIIVATYHDKKAYSLNDAVTYFDEQARFQLVHVVDEDYAIWDAKNEKSIVNFPLYYIQKDDVVYIISNPNRKEIAYSILNTNTAEIITHTDVELFDKIQRQIFLSEDNMIDLTIERSDFERQIRKIIPEKWRKW